MKRILPFTFFTLLMSQTLPAQTIQPTGDLVLNIDHAKFRNDDQSGYLEIYYSFYPKFLTYTFSDGKYRGGIHLKTKLTNEATGEVLIDRASPLQIAETDTAGIWYSYAFTTQTGHVVPLGRYTLEVVAVDSLAESRRDSLSIPIEIAAYPDQLVISDLEICKNIKPSRNKNDLFYKNSLEVIPNPALVFGVATSPVLFHYAELYNIDPDASYVVRTEILDGSGKVVRERSKNRKYKSSTAMEVGNTTVTQLSSGRYTLRCTVRDEQDNELARREKQFYTYNPHIEIAKVSPETRLEKELEGLTSKQLSEEFKVAKYVATDEEIETFEQIETESGKRDFLAKFWSKVEQGRLERAPIKRSVYLQRVEIANENFSSFGKKGALTDRGRVFILYSQPDEIERIPSEAGSKPSQKWHYFSIENGVEFVFVDRSGYGDYQLVHSTKRGELRDDLWQRLLQ